MKVTINGKEHDPRILTIDNFEELTGRRFRVTKAQMDSGIPKEQALREWLDRVIELQKNGEQSV